MIENVPNVGTQFGFRATLATAWLTVREHWFSLVLAAFLREFIALVAAGLAFSFLVDWKGWNLVAAFAVRCLAWSTLQPGYLRLCLNLCKTNQVQLRDLFSEFSSALQMLIATLCLWAAVTLGLLLLIVPGLVLAVRLSLYGLVLIDQKLGALRSLLGSHHMLRGFSRYASVMLLIYCIGIVLLGWLSWAFESFLVISLCTLYQRIRAEETSQ